MQPVSTFNGNASANELGVYVRVSGRLIVKGPEPFPQHYVDQIRREIDPEFQPLWAETVWRSPNGGIVKTGCHVLARHVEHPRDGAMLARVDVPSTPVYGFVYKQPIVVCRILDGLAEEEQERGELPRYEPITGVVIAAMQKAMWTRNNANLEQRIEAFERAEAAEEEYKTRQIVDELSYRRRNDSLQLRKVAGKADSVYVSDTLKQLREAAGMESL